jgi:uncharacterized protein YbjQ (UPF0145 family)
MQKTLALSLVSCALFGCVSESIVEVKPAAAAIKVVKEDEKPFHCKVLGDVNGKSRSGDREKARKGAEADMKNHALALKANYVVVERENAGNVGSTSTSDAYIYGKALKCEEPKEDDK